MISVQTNVTSLIAQENLRVDTNFQSQTIQRLTSGYRINSSGDDPAGLAVANGYRNSEAELTQGIQNANDGISTLQIIDGGENNIGQILDRLKTLATQSASDTFNGSRDVLNSEFQGLVSEINRQAQSIGLDQNGTFARNLSVYIGGGRAQGTTTAATNSSLQFDLSNATVDAKSLGLTGMQALGGTVGTTDIGDGSQKTSVADILAANTTPTADETDFYISGPGFSGANKVKVAVNTSSVSDTSSLVTAINDAIANAGNNATQASSTFKAANITASINTDSTGKQQLAFSSSTTAFQVEAGDNVSNALLGNFANANTGAAAAAMGSTFTGSATASAAATLANPTNVSFQIQGAGLASPVTLTLNSGSTTVGAAVTDLENQVAGNSTLAGAGITVTQASAGAALVFHSARGEQLQVNVTGDTANALGMGSFVAGAGGAVDYTQLNAAAFSTSQNYGSATLQFSINGQASAVNAVTVDMTAGPNATAAKVTSSDSTAGPVAIDPNNNTLNLVVNGTAVSVNLNTDAAATKNDIANQIDTAIAADGASASVVGNAITLTDNTKGAGGTIQVLNGTANNILGLSAQMQRGASATSVDVANQINQAVANNTTLAAAGIQADGSSGSLVITSSNNTNFRVNAVGGSTSAASITGATGANTAATAAVKLGDLASGGPFAIEANTNDQLNLSVDGGATQTITLTAGSRSQAQILADINGVLGASATASFSANKLTIVSASTGANSSVHVLAGSANADLGLTTGDLKTGAAATGASQTGSGGAFSFGANTTLRVTVAGANGGAVQSFTLSNGTVDSIVTQLNGGAGLVGAVASNVNGHLKITTGAQNGGTGTAVTITSGANDAAATLGFGTENTASTAIAAAGAYKTGGTAPSAAIDATNNVLAVSIGGGAEQDITLTHGTFTAAQIAQQINGQLVGGTASATSGNLVITSTATGSSSSVTVGGGLDTAATNLGFTGLGVAATNGVDAAAGAYTGTTAGAFTVNPGENDKLTLNITGANGNANQTITFATTDTTVDLMVTKINATLIGAVASNSGGHLRITTGTQNAGTGTAVTVVTGGVGDASGTVGLVAGTTYAVAATGAFQTGGAGTFNISPAENDKLTINVTGANGNANQVFTLGSGSQTVDQIVSSLAGLQGATASNNGGHLRITSTTGSAVTIVAGGAGDASGTVGLTAGTTTAVAATGGFQTGGAGPFSTVSGTNDTLSVKIDGVNSGNPQDITLGTTTAMSVGTMAGLINQTLIGGIASVVGGKLTITSSATGTSSGVTIVSGGAHDASGALGFTTLDTEAHGVNASAAVTTGSATGPLTITDNTTNNVLQVSVAGVNGGATQNIALTAGAGQSALTIAGQINGQLVGATASVVGGNLTITSTATGAGSNLTMINGTSLGFTTGVAAGNGSNGSAGVTTGSTSGPFTVTNAAGANDVLTVAIAGTNGGANQKITLTTGAAQSAATIAGQINAQLLGGTASVQNGKLVITSNATGNGSGVTITAGGTADASTLLGLSAGTANNGVNATSGTEQGGVIGANVTIQPANNDVLAVTIDGGATQNITLAAGSQTAADLVANINNQLTGGTAYIDQTTGKLSIASDSTGLAGSSVQVGGNAATSLGFTSPTAVGANAVTGYTINGANNTLTVSVDGLTAQSINLAQGVGLSAAKVAGDIQTKLQALGGAFANATAAATADNTIQISSGTAGLASAIRVSVSTNDAAGTLGLAEGTTYNGTAQDVGYGTGGVSFTGNTATGPTESLVSSGGATSTGALTFSALAYGSDSQAISVSATDSSGQLQSANITLANNDTSRTGRSLDETIAAINTALQQTNIPSLQSVVAVKDDSSGSEKINFISSLAAFQVSVGSTGSGTGIGSQGSTVKAQALAGGSSLDISTQQGGTAAISALTNAVSALGSAQANVGKAQNTLNYAIGLAESQTANLSAAESRIRDADMAAEAANLTKAQVLQQSAIAAMVQANSAPQAVLTLLRG